MVENLTKEELEGILDAVPVEISFVDKDENYLGCLEATQDITDIKKIEGEKRLL